MPTGFGKYAEKKASGHVLISTKVSKSLEAPKMLRAARRRPANDVKRVVGRRGADSSRCFPQLRIDKVAVFVGHLPSTLFEFGVVNVGLLFVPQFLARSEKQRIRESRGFGERRMAAHDRPLHWG
jgi:hypothetical protein